MSDDRPAPPKLRRIPHEFAIESAVILLGMALGWSLNWKVVASVSLACFRFALPDIVTAWLVWRFDPVPRHGRATAYFFVACGLQRALLASLIVGGVFLGLAFATQPVRGLFPLLLEQFSVALLIALVYLVLIFPLVLLGVWESRRLGYRILFLRPLTRLRRSSRLHEDGVPIKVRAGMAMLARISTVSLSVWMLALWLLVMQGLTELGLVPRAGMGPVAVVVVILSVQFFLIGVPVGWLIFVSAKLVDPAPRSI